jgi:hypothetical protein
LQLIASACSTLVDNNGGSIGLLRSVRVGPRPLGQEEDANDHQGRDDGRGEGTAPGKAALVQRLVDKIADSGPERPRENEGGVVGHFTPPQFR